ncbi:MAG: tyrosine-type recombinase/integrase, partial [Lentisphaeria bacterium]|nr:tyrosine-type recombinase/integrase [Lentisphaeria bacterium]
MKLVAGSIRRRGRNGCFAYRCQVNGRRTEISLQTRDYHEALKKVAELVPITQARTAEVVAAHVNEARGFAKQAMDLALVDSWEKYVHHPDRAMPHTMHEQKSYKASYQEFVEFATRSATKEERQKRIPHTTISLVKEITPTVAAEFSDFLRTQSISVHTHNRKLKRIRKVISVLKEYHGGENPFYARSLFRNKREEQDVVVRRQAFTKEEEEQLLKELRSSRHRLMNKEEIRIIYTIGCYTGQRLKDCVLLQWQNVDLPHRRIYVKQFKTGKEVSIPLAPQLYDALIEAQRWKCNQYVCPKTAERYNKTDEDGKNVGNNLVDKDVLRVIRWIGLEPSVAVPGRKKKMTVYGFHSLRHSFTSFCAEAGVPKAVLLSILGTESEIADKYYTHVGNEAQEKAI